MTKLFVIIVAFETVAFATILKEVLYVKIYENVEQY